MARKIYQSPEEQKQRDFPTIIGNCFLVILCGVFPLIMHDGYFDITETKYRFLVYSTLIFLFVMGFALWKNKVSPMRFLSTKATALYTLFLVVSCFSALLSKFPVAAFTGEMGRYRGVFEFGIYFGALFIMFYTDKIYPATVYLISVSCFFVVILGILNSFFKDPFSLFVEVWEWDRERFISTIGQIDVFGEYCGILLAALLALYVFSKKLTLGQKLTWSILYFLSVIVLLLNDSDTGHFSFWVTIFIVLSLIKEKEQFNRVCYEVFLYGGAILFWKLICYRYYERKVGGINEVISHHYYIAVVFMLLAIVFYLLNQKMSFEKLKKRYCLFTGIVLSLTVAYILIANVTDFLPIWNQLVFNADWGSGRGHLWSESIRSFGAFTWKEKLFGLGPDTLIELYNGLDIVPGFSYDSAHNCFLQLLLGVGILGTISWLGFLIIVYRCALKKDLTKPVNSVPFTVLTGYFVMSMIGIQVCFTEVYAVLAAGMLLRTEEK